VEQELDQRVCNEVAIHGMPREAEENMEKCLAWAVEVLDWLQMKKEPAYQMLTMEQKVGNGKNEFVTTRCPIRINGKKFTSPKPAPSLGEQTEKIKAELSI